MRSRHGLGSIESMICNDRASKIVLLNNAPCRCTDKLFFEVDPWAQHMGNTVGSVHHSIAMSSVGILRSRSSRMGLS